VGVAFGVGHRGDRRRGLGDLGVPRVTQTAYFSERTLDDLIRAVTEEIQARGESVRASRGDLVEIRGVALELANPRARLSRTETRGKLFSGLGELFWYLAARNDLAFIAYYIPAYAEEAEDGAVFGGYGPRLLDWAGHNQLATILDLLRRKRSSRRAVIQLFDRGDLAAPHQEIPCTCTLQFLVRNELLELITSMRSNDVFRGLSHDVFCFTMLQEIVARSLGVEVGVYKHMVGSLHLYTDNIPAMERYLAEGWQSEIAMPPMPSGDPWRAIRILLTHEARLRDGAQASVSADGALSPYWQKIQLLLEVFRASRDRKYDVVRALRGKLVSTVYVPFVDARLVDAD
jgi:thymidylate synthase